MDVFKTRAYGNLSVPISEENFFALTAKRPPYCKTWADGRESYYAVCPVCDNPIQIVGLYKMEEESSGEPYGRHHGADVPGLARYDEEAYLGCPYSRKSAEYRGRKRRPGSPTSAALYDLMRDQFDRIVHIWNKTTGISMSAAFAKDVLARWRANEDWRNYGATYDNLPYMLMFSRPACPLFGRKIDKASKLHGALSGQGGIKLVDRGGYSQVKSSGRYLDATFGLTGHRYIREGEHLEESFTLQVRDGGKVIHSEVIQVDPNFLGNLMRLPPERARRDERLLAIAREVLG